MNNYVYIFFSHVVFVFRVIKLTTPSHVLSSSHVFLTCANVSIHKEIIVLLFVFCSVSFFDSLAVKLIEPAQAFPSCYSLLQ